MRKICVTVSSIILLMAWVPEAGNPRAADSAPLYVRVDFNDLTIGSLAGQGGGTGFAADSTWSVEGGVDVRETDLAPVPPEGKHYVRSQYGEPRGIHGIAGKPGRATRKLAEPMQGTVWFRFLVRPLGETSAAGIQLLHAGAREPVVEVLVSGRDLTVRWTGASGVERRAGEFLAGETSLVLGRLDIDAGPNGGDSLSVWGNPDVTDLGEPLLKETDIDCVDQAVTGLALRVPEGDDGKAGAELDEVILSNYEDRAGYFHVAPRLVFTGPSHVPTRMAEKATPLPPPDYNLVFSDEFDVNELDTEKWDYRLGDKADSAQEAENVEVTGGHLLVHAKKQRVGEYNYTGGGVISKRTFVYGYYEARLKIPAAEGWHTSFWTMPLYDEKLKGSELDFCEQDSGDPHYYSWGVINHREKEWPKQNVGRWVIEDAPNMAEEFVVIGADFTPDYIRFYLNGRLTREVDSRTFPQGPSMLHLSCIATRKKGDRFQDDARLPSHATFDYVRVYQNPRYAEAEAAAG
ncbi:family 16 glycosylhydrolase, partial [bacterium]|nr:family 16 glycosylhydrolase [bacterium]